MTRIEKDFLGEIQIPQQALYGASTQRAVESFPISGKTLDNQFIHAMGLIKWAAAKTNHTLGLLEEDLAKLIQQAAQEVYEGTHDAHFVIDIFQTGSGTNTNMNVNEVIANRCSQLAGNPLGSKKPVHPNDHVNKGQSSNDTIPTAIHLSAAQAIQNSLLPSLEKLHGALEEKGHTFWEILKIGRTHLMDATPVRLGQEFKGYARQAERSIDRAHKALKALYELPLGGTAVGTGLNTHPQFASQAIALIAEKTDIPFVEAKDHFEAQAAKDAVVEVSGQLKTIATSLFKIANDLRWLNSGPRCGFGEITFPALLPGSSIMPGKVNPVMSESLMQVCAQIMGYDATITWCGANGNLELNVMMPVMAQNLLESIRLLANSAHTFAEKGIEGIQANKERCHELIEYSMSMVTSLAPLIGYDQAAEIAKESVATGKTVRELCQEKKVLPEEELTRALDPASMTEPKE